MKFIPTYTMPFKRRREGKTDYKRRLKLLTSKKPRLVVRKSLKYLTASIVEFSETGDKILTTASSKELKKMNWKFATDNLPAAYLTGLILGKKAAKINIKEVILDSGLHPSTKGNRIYALVKGVLDSGIKVPVSEEVFPSEDRIKGKHINEDVPQEFEKIKGKLL
jgi:large subunit ribosomal protein L18